MERESDLILSANKLAIRSVTSKKTSNSKEILIIFLFCIIKQLVVQVKSMYFSELFVHIFFIFGTEGLNCSNLVYHVGAQGKQLYN